LLVDQDDPEKRIAELERQLAERQRGAGLPPASAGAAAASGRFTGYKWVGPRRSSWPPGVSQKYRNRRRLVTEVA
jgi:hypothetical protein